MKRFMLYALSALILCNCAGADDDTKLDDEKAKELQKTQILTNDLLPKVAKATGMEVKHPVKVKIIEKAEMKEFMLKSLDEDYPGNELEKMSEAFIMVCLFPEGFDMRTTFVDLMMEQAGAFYDPRSKTYYGIVDLPEILKNPATQKMLTAHELVHALQDQNLDMVAMVEKYKDDVDRTYANTAVFEGQATVLMTTVTMGIDGRKMPDIGKTTRLSMKVSKDAPEMKMLNSVPKYLAETLVSPYAEGASFVQAFLKANPNAKVVNMFDRWPVTSEQILHYDKYTENDVPHRFDLADISSVIPEGYEKQFSSTLGELEIRVLSSIHPDLEADSLEIGKGWDGIRFSTYRKGENIFVVATSVWDSEKDAGEFASAMKVVLDIRYGQDNMMVKKDAARVSFIAGNINAVNSDAVLEYLNSAPATE